jgi:hypothetical protein
VIRVATGGRCARSATSSSPEAWVSTSIRAINCVPVEAARPTRRLVSARCGTASRAPGVSARSRRTGAATQYLGHPSGQARDTCWKSSVTQTGRAERALRSAPIVLVRRVWVAAPARTTSSIARHQATIWADRRLSVLLLWTRCAAEAGCPLGGQKRSSLRGHRGPAAERGSTSHSPEHVPTRDLLQGRLAVVLTGQETQYRDNLRIMLIRCRNLSSLLHIGMSRYIYLVGRISARQYRRCLKVVHSLIYKTIGPDHGTKS